MPTRDASPQAYRRAVILTALPVEYQAVRAYVKVFNDDVHPGGTVYERGLFTSENGTWEVLLGETGPGNTDAAMETERAIQHFAPDVILFVGVAGGVKDVRIGDVVAASKVYGYEAGKARADFQSRPNVGEASYALEQRARAVARNGVWLRRLPGSERSAEPQASVGPIAAGEKVVADRRAAIYDFLQTHYGDALAVEMEGRGFLKAARANPGVHALVIRGISDCIDAKAEADASGSQELASRHASAFAFTVLAEFQPAAHRMRRDEHASNAFLGQLLALAEVIRPGNNVASLVAFLGGLVALSFIWQPAAIIAVLLALAAVIAALLLGWRTLSLSSAKISIVAGLVIVASGLSLTKARCSPSDSVVARAEPAPVPTPSSTSTRSGDTPVPPEPAPSTDAVAPEPRPPALPAASANTPMPVEPSTETDEATPAPVPASRASPDTDGMERELSYTAQATLLAGALLLDKAWLARREGILIIYEAGNPESLNCGTQIAQALDRHSHLTRSGKLTTVVSLTEFLSVGPEAAKAGAVYVCPIGLTYYVTDISKATRRLRIPSFHGSRGAPYTTLGVGLLQGGVEMNRDQLIAEGAEFGETAPKNLNRLLSGLKASPRAP